MGAWFEAQIKNMTKAPKDLDGEEEVVYHVKYEEWVYMYIYDVWCMRRIVRKTPAAVSIHSSLCGFDQRLTVKRVSLHWMIISSPLPTFSYPENGVVQLRGKDVRPRARTVFQWHQLEEGMIVMVNYNPDEPKERGYWYDAQIQRKRETRTQREVFGKILLGYVDLLLFLFNWDHLNILLSGPSKI